MRALASVQAVWGAKNVRCWLPQGPLRKHVHRAAVDHPPVRRLLNC